MYRTITVIFLLFPVYVLAEDCGAASRAVTEGEGLFDGSEKEASYYEKAISLCPNLGSAYYDLGVNLIKRKKYAEAVQNLKKALEKEESALYYVTLGTAHSELSEYQKALEVLQKALELSPESVDALKGMAIVYKRQGDLKAAEEQLRRAIQFKPNDGDLYYNLGVVLEAAENLSEAKISFQSAINKDSNLKEAYLHLASLFLKGGELLQAETVLREAEKYFADDADVLLQRAMYFNQASSPDEAMKMFGKILEKNPNAKEAVLNLSILEAKKGVYDAGIKRLSEYLARVPEDVEVKAALGTLYVWVNDLEKAEKTLIEVREVKKGDAVLLNNLGIVYERKGERDKAIALFREASEIDPSGQEASQNLRRMTEYTN